MPQTEIAIQVTDRSVNAARQTLIKYNAIGSGVGALTDETVQISQATLGSPDDINQTVITDALSKLGISANYHATLYGGAVAEQSSV